MQRARACNEVVLSAGAIGSAQLLQVSGIGRAQHLQSLGVPIVHDLPGVGEGMHDLQPFVAREFAAALLGD